MKRRVTVEINLSALRRNYGRIVAHVAPAEVLCVLKANAYALGVATYASALYDVGCRNFGVAEPYEAMELLAILKAKNANANVQVLSSVLPDEIPQMVDAGVTLPVVDLCSAQLISEAAVKAQVRAKVHFKIDTGMGRLGIPVDNAEAVVLSVMDLPNLQCDGIFSHCATAFEIENPFTSLQFFRFKDLLSRLNGRGIHFNKVHIAASDAINNFPESFSLPFSMVRTGINLHGSFDPNGLKALDLEPVLTLKTRVAQVRTLPQGATLGYGRTHRLETESKIATICAGYADGLPMALSNKGHVFIGGRRCPILGRVSMDYTTVDVTHVPEVKPGDEVVCLGRCGDDAITPDDWAMIKGTHAYDIICSFGTRVQRVVV